MAIAFTVSEIFDDDAIAALIDGATAVPSSIATPYQKDYDAYPGGHPTQWPVRFDVSSWSVLAAYRGAQRVGGAVVIMHAPRIDLLRDYPDCALLWDIRVAPDARGQSIGSTLLRAVEQVARRRGARVIRVETQQVNVPACRFYRRHGFKLDRATHGVYPDLPNEMQLLWSKKLG